MKNKLIIFLMAAVVFAACNKDDDNPAGGENPSAPQLVKIGDDYVAGSETKVVFYAEKELFAGYNKVYFTVLDSVTGERIKPEEFTIFPKMEMMTGVMHSCPNEVPVYDDNDKQYKGAIAFVMPSGNGSWTVSFTVVNNGKTGTLIMPVEVVAPPEARIYSFPLMTDSSKSYFVSLIGPENPKVGINDFEVLVSYKATMMEWPPVSDVKIAIEPEMPDMGHGSPNNVDPVHTGNGHYKGEVNFTMTGWWRVNLFITDQMGDTLNKDRYFDITF